MCREESGGARADKTEIFIYNHSDARACSTINDLCSVKVESESNFKRVCIFLFQLLEAAFTVTVHVPVYCLI